MSYRSGGVGIFESMRAGGSITKGTGKDTDKRQDRFVYREGYCQGGGGMSTIIMELWGRN